MNIKIITIASLFVLSAMIPVSAQVTVYSGKNYTGKSYTFKGAEDKNVSEIFSDGKVGSVKVAQGWSIYFTDSWSDENWARTFENDVPDLDNEYTSSVVWMNVEGETVQASEPEQVQFNKNTLNAGEILYGGSQLVSANGQYILSMQEGDGNLCVYRFDNGKQGAFVWGSMQYGFNNAKLIMQDDGNLVVYDGNNTAKWNTETHPYFDAKFNNINNKPVKLVLENDGSLKLYTASGNVVWSNK